MGEDARAAVVDVWRAESARVVGALVRFTREPEVHGLVALMAFQTSRFAARVSAGGDAILLDDQDRALWDHRLITEGATALARSDALRRGRGTIALQAAIAEVHTTAVASYGIAAELTRNDRERETLRRLADELSTELSTGPSTGLSTGAAASSTHSPTGLSTGRKPVDPAQNQESR